MNKSVLLGGVAAIVLAGGAYYLATSGTSTAPVETAAVTEVETTTHEATSEATAPHINWYDGSVDEAFALAKAENKPVILYWGAVWCPPCAQLKSTIFKRPDFIEKTEFFVPVYLDGDTDRAQSYGEKFSVRGYPTLIIFNPEGEEVTRIPGGMNLERYASILDIALNDIRPAKELVAQIMDEDYQPTDEELDLLAHYSWGQDSGKALGDRDEAEVFNKLSSLTPADNAELKGRFEADYLGTFASAPGEDEEPFTDEAKSDAVNRLMAMLDDPVLAGANVYFVPYYASEIIKNVTDEGTEARAATTQALTNMLASMQADPALTTVEHLRLLNGDIGLANLTSGEVSDDLKKEILTAVQSAQANTTDHYEKIVVANAGLGLLIDTEQEEEAMDLLRKEMETSDTSYYWMVDLASLAEEAGKKEEAISLYRQSYETAEGNATRAQWGSYYVEALTTITPEDTATIETTVDGIFDEMAAQSDYMHARNKGAFKRIGRVLNGWISGEEVSDDRKAAHDRMVAKFDGMCESELTEEEALAECKGYMRPAES